MNTDAIMNECYNEQFLSIKLGCYNEQFLSIKSGFYNKHRCYNEQMQQQTVIINKIRMLQRTQMLKRTVFIN